MTRTHWILAGFLALLGGAGGLAFWAEQGGSSDADAPVAAAQGDDPAPEPVPTEPEPQEAAQTAPVFDTFRIEPDGSGVIAGRAAPGDIVVVRVDGEAVTETQAEADGAFVAFVSLGPSERARVMSLEAGAGDDVVLGSDTFLIAPSAAPMPVVAETEVLPGVEEQAAATVETGDLPDVEEQVAATVETGDLPDVEGETVAVALSEELPTPQDDAEDVAVVEAGEDLAAEYALVDEAVDGDAVASSDVDEGADVVAEVAEDPAAEVFAEVDAVAPSLVSEPAPLPVAPEVDVGVAVPDAAAEAPIVNLSVPALEPEGFEGTVTDGAETLPTVASTAQVPEVASTAPAAEAVAAEVGVSAPTVQTEVADAPAVATVTTALAAPTTEAAPADTPQPEVAADITAPDTPAVAEAPASLPVLVADEEGVRVLQPALAVGSDAEVLRTVALDAISYDPSGEIVLAGRASGGGAVRVYLNNRLQTEIGVADDGTWGTDLTGVEPGVYTLRLDQLDAAGQVTSRIETPFRREERAVIAAVLAEDFEDGDTQVAVRTVQAGNTLWGISQERYGEGILYVQVFEANRDLIRDPNLIYPGQILRIPESSE